MSILRKMTVGALMVLIGALPASAEVYSFVNLPMTGSQETPPVNTAGSGTFSGLYDNTTKTLIFNVNWQLQPNATVTGAHFHGPATVGQNADVVIPVTGLAATNAGRYGGSLTLTPAQESDLLAGRLYFNIHSTAATGGELRGQLVENSGSATNARFSTTTGTLTIPGLVIPQLGSYDVQLQMVPGSDPLQLRLGGASFVR